MNNLLNKIFSVLLKIGNDKLLHFIIGGMITSLIYIPCFLIFGHNNISNIIVTLTSFIIVFILAIIKDFIIDKKHDWWDIIITIIGWVFITLNHIIYF